MNDEELTNLYRHYGSGLFPSWVAITLPAGVAILITGVVLALWSPKLGLLFALAGSLILLLGSEITNWHIKIARRRRSLGLLMPR